MQKLLACKPRFGAQLGRSRPWRTSPRGSNKHACSRHNEQVPIPSRRANSLPPLPAYLDSTSICSTWKIFFSFGCSDTVDQNLRTSSDRSSAERKRRHRWRCVGVKPPALGSLLLPLKHDMNQANQDPRQSTPLPTRVSKACDRCKRNKSRCDSYRPCSLCLRANAECTSTSTKTGLSRQDSTNTEASVSRPTAVKRRRNNDSQSGDERRLRSTSRLHSFEDISDRPNPENFDNHRGDTRSDAGDDGEAESTMSMARKIYSLDQQHLDEYAVNAIPGAEIGNPTPAAPSPAVEKYPTNAYLTHPFPPSDVVIELLDEYFASVHWFSLVIYEPKFREMFTSIQDGLAEPSQKSFLILLSTMLGMASWYRSQRPESETGRPSRQWKKLSSDLFKNADNDLINIMDQNSISAIQTLILLGSFYCYHGRPNLSFSMLGASLRTAQALGLHREPSRISFHDCEERKRVWWTIYTWDM